MAIIKDTLSKHDKLTNEQIKEIVRAKKAEIVFDKDSPELTPKAEKAFWLAARDRNVRNKKDNKFEVECVINSPDMCMFKYDKLKKSLGGYYVYEDTPLRCGGYTEETINVQFDVNYSYEVLGLLAGYWGNWNNTPGARTMQEKVKEWYEKYDAELLKISHDTLTLKCRKLSEKEAITLIEEITQLYALIIDCEPEEMLDHLMKKETFTLWWD